MASREQYAQETLGPLLETMVAACIRVMPVDSASFMVKWLQAKSSGSPEPTVDEAMTGCSREEFAAKSLTPLLEPLVGSVLRDCPDDPIPCMIAYLTSKSPSTVDAPTETPVAKEDFAIAKSAVRKSVVVAVSPTDLGGTDPGNNSVNCALVLIKPHSATPACLELVRDCLVGAGIRILREGGIEAAEIEEKKIIDRHYFSVASKATMSKPKELSVLADAFREKFKLGWDDAIAKGLVLNSMDAVSELGVDAVRFGRLWRKAHEEQKVVKLGAGCYCGKLELAGREPLYVINGFFVATRSQFTAPGARVCYLEVEWDAQGLSWADFRRDVLGATDPATAPAISLRGRVYDRWQELGLPAPPSAGQNAVHASASPLEATAERCNWLGRKVQEDPFAAQLLGSGVSLEWVEAAILDPQVKLDASEGHGSLFDAVRGMDAGGCARRLKALAA